MAKKSSSMSKTTGWILMGLLIIALGGFGASNFAGGVNSIGSVGDQQISVQDYRRAIGQEINVLSRRAGRAVSFAEIKDAGMDKAILGRMVRERALDQEASDLGLSIGDEELRDRVVKTPFFQGLNGEFDRAAYTDTLRRSGMSEGEYESTLRNEAARNILQAAIVNGSAMPESYTNTLIDYIRSTRDITYALLDEAALETPVETPSDTQLRAFFDENATDYTLPAAKKITYVLLTPEDVLGDVEVSEDELRRAYDAQPELYNQPERRLVERLVFADDEAATQAAAALEVGGTSFDALVSERGLNLTDIDLGDVDKAALGGAADAVFGAEVGDVVGPSPSDLGPALFRINGILPAQTVSFEDAREELREAAAADRAVNVVEALAPDLDDLLAGGATLENLAEQSQMTLGEINWTAGSSDGIAAYEKFRDAATALTKEDFPKIMQLEDGGIFALRLEEALPERPASFGNVAEDLPDDWKLAETTRLLEADANAAITALKADPSFEDAGLESFVQTGLTRDAFVEGTPPGFIEAVFDMAPGDVRLVSGGGVVAVIRLDATAAPDLDQDEQAKALSASLQSRQNRALAEGLYNLFADDALLRVGQQIDPRAVAAVNAHLQ